MAREELDIQYNLVDNYSNQVDRLINKTKEFTQQVKQAQSVAGRGLSLAGSVAGGVAGGAAVGGGSNLFGGLVKTVGLVAGGLLIYNTIIRKAQAQMLSITQQLIHISGLLQYVANNMRRSRGQGGSPSSGGGTTPTGTGRSALQPSFEDLPGWSRVPHPSRPGATILRRPGTVIPGQGGSVGAAMMGVPLSPSSGQGGLFGTGMTGIAGLLGGLRGILPLLGTIGVSFVALSVTLGLVVVAIGTIVAAMVAFKLAIQGVQMLLETFKNMSIEGVKTFGNYQRIELSLEAFYGDAKKAKDMMEWLKKFAKTSVLDFNTLAQIAPALAAAEIPLKQAIPKIANMAAAFGPEKVQELSNALIRARGGAGFGEVFETMGRLGVSRKDFAAQGGMQFNKAGSPVFKDPSKSWEEFFAAFEKVADKKFGNIGNKMSSSFEVAMSNLNDSWSQFWAKAGAAIAPVIQKLADGLTSVMEWLDSQGFLTNLWDKLIASANMFGESLKKIFKMDESMTLMDTMLSIVFYIVAGFESLPTVINLITKQMSTFLTIVIGMGEALWTIFGPVMIGISDVLIGTVIAVWKTFQTFALGIMAIMLVLAKAANYIPGVNIDTKGLDASAKALAKDIWEGGQTEALANPFGTSPFDAAKQALGAVIPGLPAVIDTIGKRHDELYGAYKNRAQTGKTPEEAAALGESKTQTSVLRKIEENTKPLEDFKKYALGGGDLGKIGITPVEVYGRRRSVVINTSGMSNKFVRMMDELLAEYTQQLHAQEAF